MVTAPIVLLIAVATTPDGVAAANEAAAACVHALPAGARAIVRTVAAAPADAEVVSSAAAAGATATVVVTWRAADLLVSDVRVRATSTADGQPRQTDRTIVFSARDLPGERGRALGLVIASILDEDWGPGGATPGAAPAASPPGAAVVDNEVPAALAASRAARPEAAARWALEANVITAVDQQEDFDDSIGGMIALRRALGAHLALRAGVGFRVAELDGVNATARTTLGALGVAWASSGFAEGRRLGFGARADLLGVRQSIRSQGTEADDSEEQWTVGADLLGQLGLGLSSGTSLLCSAGVEGFLTGAKLDIDTGPPATIPRVRAVFELGILARF
jgi:opacity protein-like surface antigen